MPLYRVSYRNIGANGKILKTRKDMPKVFSKKSEAQEYADGFNKDKPGINARVRKL
ncbi:MAG: hypothetical protein KAJ03_00960 [Gammaproteobacteria bacterium]|nr:hypothetical protein [Gammaproteobacteria bacterium]